MRKKVSIVLAVFAALIVVFVVVVSMQPAEFRVTRSGTIAALPAAVFGHVNDLHKWEDWSPWAKLDPNSETRFEGAEAGEGAVFHWSGNDQVGEGSMTIIESKPNELVRIQLEFVRPYEGNSTSEFTFVPQNDQTQVTWTMTSKNNFMSKAVNLLMDMDAMLGSQFEEGLANMKSVVESESQKSTDEADSGN